MNSRDLRAEISHGVISSSYLITAKDAYLGEMSLNQLRKAVLGEKDNFYNERIFAEKGASPSDVHLALHTIPVMADKRVVIIRNDALLKNEPLAKMLAEYVKNPCSSSVLIVYLNEADKRTALYKAFSSNAKIVEINRAEPKEILYWIESGLARRGLKITKEALRYFAEAGDYSARSSRTDLGYYAAETDKIEAYYKGAAESTAVDLETLKKIISPNINEDIFALSDSIVSGDISSVYKNLYRLNYNKVPHFRILAEIARTMRNICICQYENAEGKSAADISASYGFHIYSVRKAVQCREEYGIEDALKALRVLLNADIMIKSGDASSSAVLELTALDLTSKTFSMIRENI